MSMSTENTETTHLLSVDNQPRYVTYRPSLMQQRYRRLRTFQCCVCSILIILLAVLIVFAVAFSIKTDPELTDDDDTKAKPRNNTNLLLKLSWPITDSAQKNICFDHDSDWKDALDFASNALRSRDSFEKLAPTLPVDSPSYRHQKVFISSNTSRLLAREGFVNENARRYLRRTNNVTFSLCTKNQPSNMTRCNESQRYRTYDGTCNNLKNPFKYGVAFTPFRRALPPDYGDGFSEPRIAKDGGALPSARDVSVLVHRPIYRHDNKFTVMLAVWGQFIDHDITATALTQTSEGKQIACCLENEHPDCFPVQISTNDPYYVQHGITCMEFVRSAAASSDHFEPRQQLNQVSSYLDGSVIYSTSSDTVEALRQFQDGKLNVLVTTDNRTLLPPSYDEEDGCNREEQNKLNRYCFLTGDGRANENLHLASMHLIWVRQHNLLASNLKELNSEWSDERIFQEVRKIVIAQLQHITYNEFLSVIIGPTLRKKLDLNPLKQGYFAGYDDNIDSSIANNFAAASFRFGHTLIPALIKVLKNDSLNEEDIRFHKMLFNPYSLYEPNGLDRTLRGALNTSIEASDTYFNDEVKSHLFEDSQNPISKPHYTFGLDLVSLNIQRGRDHGLPGYTNWRQHCGLERPKHFSDLADDIDQDALANIQQIYRDVDDIDLYTGALSERPLEGGILGPTLTCLITDQFIRMKKGDRMWYENPYKPQGFTLEQLGQIRLTTLARIICDNSDNVDQVQPYVMQRIYEGNEYTPCIEIPRPDLTKWKDADLTRTHIYSKPISVK
ncbi:hypothetical protein PPYR_05801 [Photinus pyralis]|uniref:Peroxidase n=2 Tax=Photinus pyralis TaxID=7054 RepID=A0A5N4AVV2_PHOPY|nr:peroxidase mlt-7 [Photinus pyralis]KAB0801447.1 hypothetical protein PPYR_05801 [Photinus pyralis]